MTAVETWVVSCIIHVFGVLAEYALILKMIQVVEVFCGRQHPILARKRTRVEEQIILIV